MKTFNGKLQTVNVHKVRLVAFLLPFAVFLFPSIISAQSRLTYPVADLGYCRDAKECSLYCEIPENKAACWSYGKYKLGSDILGVTTMSAQEKQMMESKARQYNITFPIADLGGCTGTQECRDYCEQSVNQTTCMDFAKKKGFQKETERSDGMNTGKRDELLVKAKTELGCTSMESCSNICETDHSRCEAFTKKHGVYQEQPKSSGRYSADEKMKLMEKAKAELGCTSMETCKSICEQNPQTCMNFSKKNGFDRPDDQNDEVEIEPPDAIERQERRQGPGNGKCDSDESCKKYCQEHPKECPGFRPNTPESVQSSSDSTTRMSSKGNYMGPSGCRTEAECNNWCTDHPDSCPGFTEAKTKKETSKREYEQRKNKMENQQEIQKREFESNREMIQERMEEYRPQSGQSYPASTPQPSYQNQPSSGSYTPLPTQQVTP